MTNKMLPLVRQFSPLALAVFLAAWSQDAHAAGFVKNADVGGYRVIVEGGGVEARKEIQYDSDGNVIYDSRGLNLQQFNKGTIDNSLLGGGLELNLDPTDGDTTLLPQDLPEDTNAENTEKAETTADETGTASVEKADLAEKQKKRPRSPWAASPAAIARAKKILAQRQAEEARQRAEEKKREAKSERNQKDSDESDDNSVFVDPRSSLVDQPMTKDGRKMPFFLTGKGVEKGEADPSAGLKDFMRLNENYGANYETGTYDLEMAEGHSNIISMKEWHSKFSTLGGKRTDRYSEENEVFSGRYETQSLERRLLDNTLMWDRTRESQISVNESLARKLVERYTTGTQSGKFDMRLPAPGERTGLSMQDINRYQFRRSHSTEKGLPVVQPAGGLKNIQR